MIHAMRCATLLLGFSRIARAQEESGVGAEIIRRVAREFASAAPGLALAGSYLDGVGIPDALASGLRAGRDAHASAL